MNCFAPEKCMTSSFSYRYEEATLLRFYPTQYPSYVGRTYIGIPFVAGFTMPEDTATGEKRE